MGRRMHADQTAGTFEQTGAKQSASGAFFERTAVEVLHHDGREHLHRGFREQAWVDEEENHGSSEHAAGGRCQSPGVQRQTDGFFFPAAAFFFHHGVEERRKEVSLIQAAVFS